MVPYLGDFPEDQSVFVALNTFDSNDPSASVTITNLADTDIHIHKNDGTTQHSSATDVDVQINFDSVTGNHMVEIRTTNAFFTTGADYFVRMEGTTVDAGTVNAWIAHFSIENRYHPITETQSGYLTAGVATATSLATAQLDLDTLTGTDGATLATAQGNYAPSKAGDAMSLTAGAITDASLAGNMEIVFETDFATNYNVTRNAWVTNFTDFLGSAPASQASVDTIDGIVDNIWIGTNLVGADTQDIQSRLPAALVTGRMASDAVAVSGSTAAADSVEANIGNLDAPVSTVDTVVDAILVNTAEIGAAGAGLTAINLPNQTMDITGSLSGSVGSVAGAVTGAVGSVAGNVDGNVTGTVGELAVQAKADVNAECDTAITDNFTSLDEINKGAKGVLTGACSGTPTTTSVATTDLTDVTADAYKDGWLVMTSGNAAGDRKQITASSEAGGTTTLTVDALSQAPVATDTFIIV